MFKAVLFSLFALALISLTPAQADTDLRRTIALTGHAEVKTAPDMAVVNLGVFSQGATAKAALEANTKNMSGLMAVLKAAGIDDKDIQTANFSVGPRYDNSSNNNPPKVIGYNVSNSVVVTVHKLDDLGGILDKAVGAGSNQIDSMSFTVSDPQELQDQARKSAVQDAQRKAALMAEAAGAKLGNVLSINDSTPGPIPMSARGGMVQYDMAAKAAPVPVAQGEMVISSDVNVVWELTSP